MSYLRYLCLFFVQWCPTHIVLCFCFVLFVFVLCSQCCQFLWIVHFFIGPSVLINVYLFTWWKNSHILANTKGPSIYILCISWGLWYNCCEWFTLRFVISKRTGMPPWCVARLQLNRICRNRISVSVMIILFYCCPFTNTIFNDLSRGKIHFQMKFNIWCIKWRIRTGVFALMYLRPCRAR